jgi:hypothetical protein
VASAFAADVLLYAPDGAPAPGESAAIDVAVSDGGHPVAGARVQVAAGAGAAIAPTGEIAPGRYRFRYRSPVGETTAAFEVRIDDGPAVARTLPLAAPPPPTFGAPGEVDAGVGTPRIELRFPRIGGAPGAPGARVARVSEGRVIEVREEADAVIVVVEPGAERQARVMAVALLDVASPRQTPVFGIVRLRARPQLTLTADPGSTLSVRVAKRTYGPFVADSTGAAVVTFDVFPGETAYEVTVADDLGNTQRSQGPLPGVTRPVLVGVDAPRPGHAGAELTLAAWSPSGAAWTGAAPVCRSGAGVRADAIPVSKGLFRYDVDAPDTGGALFDPRVECGLADATVAFRIPLGAERADRIELRVYPDALSADFPIAQVQAALLDRRGERLPPDALRLSARTGDLTVEPADGALRGDYRGGAAVEQGGDELTATWNHPAGTGPAWSLELSVASQVRPAAPATPAPVAPAPATPAPATPTPVAPAPAAPAPAGIEPPALVAIARALDHEDRPLAGVPVRVYLGDLSRDGVSDPRGWVRFEFPGVPADTTVVRAEAGALAREVAFFPAAPDPLPDPAAPDLVARVNLPIRAGRVRQVFLDVTPRPLLTGSGATGTVVVRMLDAANNPVRDEPVQITASEGEVGPTTPGDDGSLQARYTPPVGLVDRTVQISATTSAGTVSTLLALAPRPVEGGVSVAGGWISNFGTVSAPALSVSLAQHIPRLPRLLTARIGVTAYSMTSEVDDPVAGETIGVRATLVPIELGLQATERWGPRSLSAGISAVVAPYSLTVDFGDTRGIAGLALASPGLALHGGAGYRLGSSELFAEAGFLLFSATGGQVSFEGSLGGVSLTAGYRLLY